MIALMGAMLEERIDLPFEIAGQDVVFQKHVVLECVLPAFDLAQCFRMHRCTVNFTSW